MGERNLDQELVERVQNGEKAAFDILVRKYEHKLANVISRYIHDQSEVLDVAQDAFIKAYRALPNFRGDSAFYTWLYRIAINTAKNYLVAQGRRPLLDPEEPERAPRRHRILVESDPVIGDGQLGPVHPANPPAVKN